MTPWLTTEEIADLCAGLKQPAAQARYLRRLGLNVLTKPNGHPLVLRAEFDRLTGGQKKPDGKREPNRLALIASLKRAA